ncbi:MAG: FkbM family methyltransferase [Verrucomicrobiota bacterium]
MNPLRKILAALRDYRNHPLNRGRRNQAVLEYGFIQLAARMVPGEICVSFPNDTRLLVPPHMKGAAHYISPRLCEFEPMAFTMHFLRGDDQFADVGANIGAFTVLAAGVAGCSVRAFEPSPASFGTLTRNVRLNDIVQRVKLVNAAAGRTAGSIPMSTGQGTENHIATAAESAGTIPVKVTTLDAEFAGEDPPVCLKVDVEGFETEAFAGAENILAAPKLQAIIVERNRTRNRYGFDENELHEKIRQRGFKPFLYDPFKRELIPMTEQTTRTLIYLRDLETACSRLKNARLFHLDDLRA